MRKILLATTALVAVAGISAANAEVSLSGNSAISYSSHSDDQTNGSGVNDTAMGSDSDLGASWSETTDTGLSLSVSWDVDANDSTGSISGDFGTIAWADAGDSDGAAASGDADTVEDGGYTGDVTITHDGTFGGSGGNISYTSPTVSGFTFTVGQGDAGLASTADESSYSIGYAATVNGADVSIGYAVANVASADDADASEKTDFTSLNGSVTVGDLTVSVASNKAKAVRGDDNASAGGHDITGSRFGVSYALTDSLSLTAQSASVSGTDIADDYKYDESSYGAAYTIASGVDLYGSFTDYSQSGTTGTTSSGTGTVVKLTVSF